MARVTEPLREEHKELFPHLETLRRAADALSGPFDQEALGLIEEARGFLTGHLIPHAAAEEEALYPVVAATMGAPLATRTMSRDHVEVGRLTEELTKVTLPAAGKELDEGTKNRLRALLYGLSTLVKVHFAKEEEVYLPMLDEKLDAESARRMFEKMEEAAGRAKARVQA